MPGGLMARPIPGLSSGGRSIGLRIPSPQTNQRPDTNGTFRHIQPIRRTTNCTGNNARWTKQVDKDVGEREEAEAVAEAPVKRSGAASTRADIPLVQHAA